MAEGVEIGPDRASYGLGSARRDDGNETRWTHTAKGVRIGAAMQTKDARRDGDTIRVPVVLANDFEETNGGPESAPGVRRVVTEGLVDLVDTRVTPLWVPEDLVRRLGLRERDRRWEGRPWAGPIAARIGGRTTVGECVVGPSGSAVRIGTMTLRVLDLVPDPVTRTLQPGTGIRV